jgi:hypothetical protein
MFRQLLQPKIILFFVLGIAVGTFFLWFGLGAEAPGVCLIGLMTAFLLIMRGIYHGKIMRKGHHLPFILFVFAMIGFLLPFSLYLNQEIEFLSKTTAISWGIGIAMIIISILLFRKNSPSHDKKS